MTIQKINPEIKPLIVEALLSGEYTQGRWGLRNSTNDMCCIGVATDVAAKHGVVEWEQEDYKRGDWGIREDDGILNTTSLSSKVAEWLGVPSGGSGDIHFGEGSDATLMTLNDHEDRTFPEIAEVIKEKL